ncbi:MAG: GntR family transcriptional regulator [Rubrobacteraceae bacterium]
MSANGEAARVPIRISMDDPEPMYRQIEAQLKDFILSGQLPAGTRLPSVRGLAKELACSVITTRRAYQDLENEGFLRTRQGMGTVVAEIGEEAMKLHRREPVVIALREAAEAGRRAGYSGTELQRMFERVLEERSAGVRAAE